MFKPLRAACAVLAIASCAAPPPAPPPSSSAELQTCLDALNVMAQPPVVILEPPTPQPAAEPIYVPKNADDAEMERKRQQLTETLNAATAKAYALVDGAR